MNAICHLTTVHRRDDVRIFTKECVSLVRRYHNVSLVVFDGLGSELSAGVRIHDLGKPPTNRLKRMVLGQLYVLSSKFIHEATVVHFHDPELLVAAFLLQIRGKTVIYDAHEDAGAQIKSKHYIPSFVRPVLAWCVNSIEALLIRRFDGVVAATPYIGKRLHKRNSSTVVVCNYPVIQKQLGSSGPSKASNALCYVGAITRERGFVELLDALNLCDDVKLLACGPFESVAFEKELKNHSGWKHVEYKGIVKRKETQEIMRRARAGVVLFKPGPNHNNSQPNKLFEYMSAGLPVIASDFPLWREIVEGNKSGLLVDPLKPQEIASAIRYITDHQEEAERMGANGRKAVYERFNWSSEEARLFDFYDLLIGRGIK